MNRRTSQLLLTCLIAAVVTAGCVGLPDADNSETNKTETDTDVDGQPTEVVRTLSTDNPSIYLGNREQLSLVLQNPRNRPLQNVRANIGNYGQLGIVRLVPDRGQTGLSDHQCRYREIPEETGMNTPKYRCIWRLSTSQGILGDARDRVTFPLTAFVTYRSELPMTDSVSASFARPRDIRPGDKREEHVQASNQEITLTLRHTSPVSAEDGTVPVTIEIRNTGPGDIVDLGGARPAVNLSFHGTLADARWDMVETTCVDTPERRWQVVQLDGDSGRTTLSCIIALHEPDLADHTYTLRTSATYRYRVISETSLTVLKPK